MKQRITIIDLTDLTTYQRDRLNELWIPQRYDMAAGFLCMDAENNKYDVFEFVVGNVNIRETRGGYHMTLMNLEGLRGWGSQHNTAAEAKEEISEEADTDELDYDYFEDEDFVYEYERPDIYSKSDCMPLLSIGQMFEILERCEYGNGNFYVNCNKGENECGVGRDIEQFVDYGIDYKNEELCDALWEAIKEIL